MVGDVALETKTSRDILRKAGLKQERAVGGVRTRTIVDAWIIPSTTAFENQWYVDLTPYTRIRMLAQIGGEAVRLFYSLSEPGALNPGDWEQVWHLDEFGLPRVLESDRAHAIFDSILVGWSPIVPELRRPLRLALGYDPALSSTDFTIFPVLAQGPFNITVEAS